MEVSRGIGAWEKIIKSSIDIICTTDRNGCFININEACEHILGYEPGELIGRPFREFLCSEDLPESLKIMQDVTRGYKASSFENRFIHKNGQEVPIIWSAVWSEEDEVIISVGRDVTEQQLTRKKVELHHALVEHGADMLALLDINLNCLYAGNTTVKELGYRPEQLIGTNAIHYIHPSDISIVREALSKVLVSGGYVKVSDFRFKDANGNWHWLETTLSNQLDNPAVRALVVNARDITERNCNKFRLQESQQRFKSLFDHHLDIVLFQNKEGVIIDLNTAALSFFGVQKHEVLNRPFSDFIPDEIVPVCEETLQDALSGESVRFDMIIPFEGKGLCVFDMAKIPVVVNGEIIGVYNIMRDVTEISQSNATIKRQAAKLNTIMESITDAFFTLDRSWNFTYINKEFERVFGTDRTYILGKNYWDLIAGKSIEQEHFRQFSQAVETGKTAHFESYLREYDLWLQVKAYPSAEGLSVFQDDISESVKAKQELEKLSLVASKTTNGVLIMGADRITEWVNEGFETLTGYAFSEVVGLNACVLLQGKGTDKATLSRIQEKIGQGSPFTEEVLNYKKSGEKLWLLLDMTPVLNENGEVTRLIIVQTDITFRKEAEASQLQLTKDLFTQNRDLQQFTYIVSHNLRSPVANAMGLVDLLRATDKSSENFDIALNYLSTSIDKLDTVLRDLNKILSIRSKQGTVEKEEIQLAPVCRQAIEEQKEQLRECAAEVHMNIEDGISVHGNKAYLYSIFTNLLSNAIKYRAPERPLRVNIKSFGRNESGTIISFSDNGSGFDLNLAGDKVFQLYKRFHTNSDGRGIGLFLVKTHLEAMGGNIEVSSQVNIGTRFLIYFKSGNGSVK